MYAGELYLNVHTSENPAGEVRGQIYPSAGAGLQAALTPEQETADVASEGSGTAAVLATDAGVAYFVTVTGLTGEIAAAHFHQGPIGEDGPVVRTITFEDNTAVGLWTPEDDEPLTDELRDALLTGGLYLNVHTAEYPAGEIRGQVVPAGGWGFTSTLDAEQETEDVDSDGTGTASLTLTEAGLIYHLTVHGLTGDIMAAHFHRGLPGEDGPVVHTISDAFDGTTASGVWRPEDADEPLTDELLVALLNGELYLNVHTAQYPAGEIRGQVLLNDGTSFTATMRSSQEVHDVEANARGTAALNLTDEGLAFAITVDSLTGGIAAAHFHQGATGVDGPVVRTITFDGNTADGIWTAEDDEPLTSELLEELLTGGLYLNVHTSANPNGEVRGQVYPSSGAPLRAFLTAEQETEDVASEATGTAEVMLTDAGVVYRLTVDGLTGEVSAAHFHEAPIGVAGPVVHGITDAFEGNTAVGVWSADDAEPLTAELVDALLTGELYLNVHTAENPPGEIRGQVLANGGFGSAVLLDAEQETEEVDSDGSGTASLTLTEAGLIFDLTAQGLTGDIQAAHFHNAAFGTDGPVVRGITDSFVGNTASGVWQEDDAEPLTVELLNELLTGRIYLNVHTAVNPAGEIRGQIDPGGVVVTAIERIDDQVPERFTLAQNYPNPFNPVTTIAFSLPQSGHTVLTVYNSLGQRVATLVDGRLPAGQYEVTFEARGLPSGLYHYRLDAGSHTTVRQMLLLK